MTLFGVMVLDQSGMHFLCIIFVFHSGIRSSVGQIQTACVKIFQPLKI